MRRNWWMVLVAGAVGCAAPTETSVPETPKLAGARSKPVVETRAWYPYCFTYNSHRGCLRFDATATRVGRTVTLQMAVQNLEGTLVPVNATPVTWLQLNGWGLEYGGAFDETSVTLAAMGTTGKVTRADAARTLYALWGARWNGGSAFSVSLINGASAYAEPGAITGCSTPALGFATCGTKAGRVTWEVTFLSDDWSLQRAVLGTGANMRLPSGQYVGIGCSGAEVPGTCAVESAP
jgi:hypothetical protein